MITIRMRRTIKKILKILRTFFLSLFALIITYMFFALLFSLLPTHPPEKSCLPVKNIYITSNGVHLDIIIPVEDIKEDFIKKLDILPGTEYVSFGWGDKEFYIKTPEWSDLTFPVAFRALFLKSNSAMHVTCYFKSYDFWEKINLCQEQLNTMNDYIEHSFKKTEDGDLNKLSFPGYTAYDNFYNSHGSFSIFRTCNVWTNNALKEIGIKTSVWSPFTFGVLYHLK
jgi:uncharacterized protein (TIGR02117 family)